MLKIWLPFTSLCLLRTKEHPHVLAQTAVYSPLICSQMLTNQKEIQEEWKEVKSWGQARGSQVAVGLLGFCLAQSSWTAAIGQGRRTIFCRLVSRSVFFVHFKKQMLRKYSHYHFPWPFSHGNMKYAISGWLMPIFLLSEASCWIGSHLVWKPQIYVQQETLGPLARKPSLCKDLGELVIFL